MATIDLADNSKRLVDFLADLPDTINGLNGNDTSAGLGTNDTLNGDAGTGNINSGIGADTILNDIHTSFDAELIGKVNASIAALMQEYSMAQLIRVSKG